MELRDDTIKQSRKAEVHSTVCSSCVRAASQLMTTTFIINNIQYARTNTQILICDSLYSLEMNINQTMD